MPLSRVLVALAIVLSMVGGLHTLLWMRLLRDPRWPSPLPGLGGAALLLLALSVIAAFLMSRFGPPGAARVAQWVGFTWLGTLFYVLLMVLPMELVWFGDRLAGWLGYGLDPDRRLLLHRAVAAVAGLGGSGLGALGVWTMARGPEVIKVTVPLERLDPRLAGLKIAQISDIHLSATRGVDFMKGVVEQVNALDADVVAITGDLVDGSVEQLAVAAAPLAGLKARHGVFFVTGNHEYYSGARSWVAHLGTLGVRVLRNQRVRIERDGAALDLAGIDDHSAHRFPDGHGADLSAALRGRDPDVPVVLLAHQPKAIFEAEALGVDLQLSGHTHGGQLAPLGRMVRLDQPAVAGLERFGDTWLYVNRGTGTWGPAMRVGVPAEITHLELVPVG